MHMDPEVEPALRVRWPAAVVDRTGAAGGCFQPREDRSRTQHVQQVQRAAEPLVAPSRARRSHCSCRRGSGGPAAMGGSPPTSSGACGESSVTSGRESAVSVCSSGTDGSRRAAGVPHATCRSEGTILTRPAAGYENRLSVRARRRWPRSVGSAPRSSTATSWARPHRQALHDPPRKRCPAPAPCPRARCPALQPVGIQHEAEPAARGQHLHGRGGAPQRTHALQPAALGGEQHRALARRPVREGAMSEQRAAGGVHGQPVRSDYTPPVSGHPREPACPG